MGQTVLSRQQGGDEIETFMEQEFGQGHGGLSRRIKEAVVGRGVRTAE